MASAEDGAWYDYRASSELSDDREETFRAGFRRALRAAREARTLDLDDIRAALHTQSLTHDEGRGLIKLVTERVHPPAGGGDDFGLVPKITLADGTPVMIRARTGGGWEVEGNCVRCTKVLGITNGNRELALQRYNELRADHYAPNGFRCQDGTKPSFGPMQFIPPKREGLDWVACSTCGGCKWVMRGVGARREDAAASLGHEERKHRGECSGYAGVLRSTPREERTGEIVRRMRERASGIIISELPASEGISENATIVNALLRAFAEEVVRVEARVDMLNPTRGAGQSPANGSRLNV